MQLSSTSIQFLPQRVRRPAREAVPASSLCRSARCLLLPRSAPASLSLTRELLLPL
jgi:hypothetical protein